MTLVVNGRVVIKVLLFSALGGECMCAASVSLLLFLSMTIELFSLFAFIMSAVLTALMIPQIIMISFKKRLFDPIDERKVHTGIVPRFGGLAFIPSVLITLAFLIGVSYLFRENSLLGTFLRPHYAFLLCAFVFLYIEGMTDDLLKLGYKVKFACQTLCSIILVGSGFYIDNLFGFLGIYELPLWIAYPFNVVLAVFIINAVNLIDGIDGLAAGLSMVALLILGLLFIYMADAFFAIVSFATLGTLFPFFLHNVFGTLKRHNKIFMGDCGSQTLGFILAVLCIHFAMQGTLASSPLSINALVIAFSVVLVPCFDVLRVMVGRIRRGKSPFLPDKSHIHHKLLALGMTHRKAMMSIVMVAVFFVILNIGLSMIVGITAIVAIDIVLYCLLMRMVSRDNTVA